MTAQPTLTLIENPVGEPHHVDASLVAAIATHDEAALREAYTACAAGVNGVALGILKDHGLSADITQDVFVRLWKDPSRYNPTRGSLLTFLKMDAHGRSIDKLRSMRSSAKRDLNDHHLRSSEHVAGTEELAMTSVASSTVRDALMTLPSDQRTPISMSYFDGYSYREVSEILGVPEGTIKSRIRAGMRRLQLLLAAESLA